MKKNMIKTISIGMATVLVSLSAGTVVSANELSENEIIIEEAAGAEEVSAVGECESDLDDKSNEVSENALVETKEDELTEVNIAGADIEIKEAAGYEEGAYAIFESDGEAPSIGYRAYVTKNLGDPSGFVQVDDKLIRKYKDYFRVDVPGLTKGEWYIKLEKCSINSDKEVIKVLSSVNTGVLNVSGYDRTGFAFAKGSTVFGGYKMDGSLADDAEVYYVTEENYGSISSIISGIGSKPAVIRIIGCLEGPKRIEINSKSAGITIEGIGDDATIYGGGFYVKNSSKVEIRNLGIMNASYGENDDIGIDGSNNVWIHNNDLFYGARGSESDMIKGDGAADCKKSYDITFSYNHFWDNGKTSLLGSGNSETVSYGRNITYHHNWYDHTDERNPRIRFYTVHIYNNYFDGVSKYGIGITNFASAFAENNYFRNTKYPMLTSMQGSDMYRSEIVYSEDNGTFSQNSGGIIKAYGNKYAGKFTLIPYGSDTYVKNGVKTAFDLLAKDGSATSSKKQFDMYAAASKDEAIPNYVVFAYADSDRFNQYYNNFDTNRSLMYSYEPDDAMDVPGIVAAKAGRHDGGDFWWNFNNSHADDDSGVDMGLMSAIEKYSGSVVYIGGFDSYKCKSAGDRQQLTRKVSEPTSNTNGYVFDDKGESVFVGGNDLAKDEPGADENSFEASYIIKNTHKLETALSEDSEYYSDAASKGIYSIKNYCIAKNTLDALYLKSLNGVVTINAPGEGELIVHAGTEVNSDTYICGIRLKNAAGDEVTEETGLESVAQRQPSTFKYKITAKGTYEFGYRDDEKTDHRIRIYNMTFVPAGSGPEEPTPTPTPTPTPVPGSEEVYEITTSAAAVDGSTYDVTYETNFTYNGKKQLPAVKKVIKKDGGAGQVVSPEFYKISYKNNVNSNMVEKSGSYERNTEIIDKKQPFIQISFKNDYKASKKITVYFDIRPRMLQENTLELVPKKTELLGKKGKKLKFLKSASVNMDEWSSPKKLNAKKDLDETKVILVNADGVKLADQINIITEPISSTYAYIQVTGKGNYRGTVRSKTPIALTVE